ncbi:MAG: radical SAM protein [Candidatus Bathyarchaeota archaeon]|nr:radical SAM protein [Candidatus Bathyarchaeota archaeon]
MPETKLKNKTELPAQVRVSVGTAIVLGLLEGKMDAEPTTAYLMTHKTGKCSANCGFCPQARGSKSNTELLSRVTWPAFPTAKVLKALSVTSDKEKIKRVCIQALNYPSVFVHLVALVKEIKKHAAVPVSVSCQPLNKENMKLLAKAGVDRLGIALDAATKALFDKVKGKDAGGTYSWESQFRLLNDANAVFGRGNVSTHLILGLGETEKEAVAIIQKCVDMSVLPALFAFTPVRGTAMEEKLPPPLESYRRVQLARHLIVNGKARVEDMRFNDEGTIICFGVTRQNLEAEIDSGLAFRTSGCPDCNRPFYNEKPSGPIYNYPTTLSRKETEKVKRQLLF